MNTHHEHRQKKISTYSWPLFMCLLAPFVMPEYFTQFSFVVTLYKYSRYVSIFIILALIFLARRMPKECIKDIIPFILYESAIIGSTYLNNGLISVAWSRAFTVLAIVLIFDWGIRVSPEKFLKGSLILFEILTYLNFIFLILHPEGLYNIGYGNTYHLLGHRNVMIRYLLPGICIALLHSCYHYQRITLRCWVLIAASYLSVIWVWSASSLTTMTVIIVLLILVASKHYPSWLNYDTFFASSIIIFISIVILRLQYFFSYLIVDILHKSTNFTGRTVFWDFTLQLIAKKPLTGYGLQSIDDVISAISFNAPHNFYLEMLLQGGLFQIACMLLIILIVGHRFRKKRANLLVSIFSIIFFGYFILWNFEPFWEHDSRLMYGLFAIAFSVNSLLIKNRYTDNIKT